MTAVCLSILLFLPAALALFPGRAPDEGDVRHLYPITHVAVGLSEHAHSLPYILGFLENIDYPKHRIHLELYVLSKEDSTEDQVVWWKSSVSSLFLSVNIFSDDVTSNWMESALRNGRMKKLPRVLLISGDTIPSHHQIIQRLSSNSSQVIVSAFLAPPFLNYASNAAIDVHDRKGPQRVQLPEAVLPMLIRLDLIDASYLTFDADNLPNYEGAGDPMEVFSESATRMGISIWIDTGIFGTYFDQELELDQKRDLMRYWIADGVADGRSSATSSRTVRPWTPEPYLFGLDKIYLINLDRRLERLRRMDKIFSILGISYDRLSATDGLSLPPALSFSVLPGYEDPFHKRPIKTGEIGCFMSHYRIWEEMVEKRLARAIVFEDDARFSVGGMKRVEEVLEDLDGSRMEWDLIYLGRKKLADQEELWVPGHRHLSTVGYSYWTLGYMISLSGAERLLAAKPLERLLPVDEFLPIIFDRHPNTTWSSAFPVRNLRAFTLYPLVVTPQRYSTDPDVITDTEQSTIFTATTTSNTQPTTEREEL